MPRRIFVRVLIFSLFVAGAEEGRVVISKKCGFKDGGSWSGSNLSKLSPNFLSQNFNRLKFSNGKYFNRLKFSIYSKNQLRIKKLQPVEVFIFIPKNLFNAQILQPAEVVEVLYFEYWHGRGRVNLTKQNRE